ncbi:hypothetical protein SDRG_01301 [Saprolegnia diclina VS20]|uniref:Transmembrane protein n=1 Tax=Saprolegnia diclina (strain VS20) TaxID=1156394 RepID=T0SEH4_SAPDV|nr:hypothetical protein SDRG_01301 [Saprolegnia diclina VS20]EQC41327.1 hypothetical protein SDRG_01301 [Saprolegnia diclina VS20]|eukprot:XP_008605041.1 hypothetical protein SDRG_01301 [Saprolegnia diclina VS20]
MEPTDKNRRESRLVSAAAFVRKRLPFGMGMALSLLYMGFAGVVAVTTYTLTSIANQPVFTGLIVQAFDYNRFDVPVTTLLQGSSVVVSNPTTLSSTQATWSVSDLHYKECGVNDVACANAFLAQSNMIWSTIGRAFDQIPAFDDPLFQDKNQIVKFKHINNLSGFNKPSAQFYIDGHATAVTCLPAIDCLAYCSVRAYDPKWMCENEVPMNTNTFAIQMRNGRAVYLGVAKRSQFYFNAGKTTLLSGGLNGTLSLVTVATTDEYQSGVLQANAPWDIVPASQCGTYNFATNLGCDSLMLTNAVVLFVVSLAMCLMQAVFLRHSCVCYVPVHLSKNVLGLVILFVAYYGNNNLQTLTTYILCGPAQMASIVGIMTGTLIQIWFNPRVVTQTWLVLFFSVANWVIVFYLEGFVYPYKNSMVANPCGLATSTNCFLFDAIPHTYYQSAIIAGGVIVFAILVIYAHSRLVSGSHGLLPTSSVLRYLNISNVHDLATSTHGCVGLSAKGTPALDAGVLIIKNMLRVSNTQMTRTTNVQYELIYRLIPTAFLKRFYSSTVGSMLVFEMDNQTITRRSSYKFLHDMDIGHMDNVTGFLD